MPNYTTKSVAGHNSKLQPSITQTNGWNKWIRCMLSPTFMMSCSGSDVLPRSDEGPVNRSSFIEYWHPLRTWTRARFIVRNSNHYTTTVHNPIIRKFLYKSVKLYLNQTLSKLTPIRPLQSIHLSIWTASIIDRTHDSNPSQNKPGIMALALFSTAIEPYRPGCNLDQTVETCITQRFKPRPGLSPFIVRLKLPLLESQLLNHNCI